MRERLTGREAEDAVIYGSREEDAEAIDGATRFLGKARMQPVEADAVPLLQPVEPRVQPPERFTVRGQHQQTVG